MNKAILIEAQIAVAERNLVAANAKVLQWQQRLEQLRRKQLALRIESKLPLGPSTRKNEKKYLVWYAVKDILAQHDARSGLTTSELLARAREDFGPLNAVTFRAYLRDFARPPGLLIKKADRWHLPTA